MGSAIPLRSDYDGGELRHLAKQTDDAIQARRLLRLAVIGFFVLTTKAPAG